MTSQPLKYLRPLVRSYALGYLLLAAACVVRWGTPHPWSRMDLPVCGYFLLRLFGSVHSLVSARRVYRDRQTVQEWWATKSEPGGIRRVVILMGLDLSVFLYYGHGQLVSMLDRPALKACGLFLYAAACAAQIWTDNYLARFFANASPAETPMTDGPYRYVRHPRYFAALAGKAAFALIFANWLGWVMVLAWSALLIRKVEVEEAYLLKSLGRNYEAYRQSTRKLVPGIY
jgi:protein-S-isoprenylcysteine O-methyltransferase Ste14